MTKVAGLCLWSVRQGMDSAYSNKKLDLLEQSSSNLLRLPNAEHPHKQLLRVCNQASTDRLAQNFENIFEFMPYLSCASTVPLQKGSAKHDDFLARLSQFAPDGSKEMEDWRDATPSCAPDGSKEKEDWREKTKGPHKRKNVHHHPDSNAEAKKMTPYQFYM